MSNADQSSSTALVVEAHKTDLENRPKLDIQTVKVGDVRGAIDALLRFNYFPILATINPESARFILDLYEALLVEIKNRGPEGFSELAELIRYVRNGVNCLVQEETRFRAGKRLFPFFLDKKLSNFLSQQSKKHAELELALQRLAIGQIEKDVEAFFELYEKIKILKIHVSVFFKTKSNRRTASKNFLGSAINKTIDDLFSSIQIVSKRLTSVQILTHIQALAPFERSWDEDSGENLVDFLAEFQAFLDQEMECAIENLFSEHPDPYR